MWQRPARVSGRKPKIGRPPGSEFPDRVEIRVRAGDKRELAARYEAENAERSPRYRFASMAAWMRRKLGLRP